MRGSIIKILTITAVAFLLIGCGAKAKPELGPEAPVTANGKVLPVLADQVARITVEEAKKAVESGEAVIVDVRLIGDYRQEHIKGAISLPSQQTGSRVTELPKDKLLITYCSCPAEQQGIAASQMYRANRYFNTATMVGGTAAWKAAGYPMSLGDKP